MENHQQSIENQQISGTQSERKFKTSFLVLIVVVSLLCGGVAGAFGALVALQNPAVGNLLTKGTTINQQLSLSEDSAIIDTVKKASPAVVSIVVTKDLSKIPGFGSPYDDDPFFNFFFGRQSRPSAPNIQQVGAGSGFFVSDDGLILTNKHVVSDEQASYTVLTSDGKKYQASILASDPVNDIALVKIDIRNAPKLELSDSGVLQVGQRVIAIGNSLGQYQNTVTTGIVSGIGRRVTAGSQEGYEQLEGVIQTDAAINPGNSGGPLLNVLGQVVGINTAIDLEGQLVGFAIPSNDAAKAVASYQKNGRITRAYLGVRYVMVTPDIAEQEKLGRDFGALLVAGNRSSDRAVLPGSPADQAGLRENDIILEVDGKKLDQNVTLSQSLKDRNVGDSVTVKYFRQGSEKTVQITLGESK